MVPEIWGDHIADGQISSCSRRTGNDTQPANEKKKKKKTTKKKKKKKKKKKRNTTLKL
jgi:hypothetical protein